MIVVMQKTIDWLIESKQFPKIDELMGENLPWEQKETKTEIKYYKLN
jgi:hypothetical protein